ncbi:CmcI family methyltransferase [Desulfosoma sp.]
MNGHKVSLWRFFERKPWRAAWRRFVEGAFARLFYGRPEKPGPWHQCTWMGVPTLKCPLDLWIYQEILWTRRPDLIVECGTAYGGSALFLASMCDLLGHGHVVSVDIRPWAERPRHRRITYLLGDSTSPAIFQTVRDLAFREGQVMVLLDSDHRCNHVLRELRLYAPLVSVGQYLIVEDTNINGHPVLEHFGPGPMEAVELFLEEDGRFLADRSMERFGLTFNPKGYLKRIR